MQSAYIKKNAKVLHIYEKKGEMELGGNENLREAKMDRSVCP